ncbi:MAG: transporter [Cytophagales bacterium CG12_big_fil_rev_8_21_14_0_65_40_12]|nr:MAG: transporter [Cytophagales bacterium CG12_big_fil_rev_8_21_14_0_65_40_12]PIW03575.1 MAG: transporter [Cytophagales bacterium CG17_big_fil_post_rev_8_21_14_2_50_40_13]
MLWKRKLYFSLSGLLLLISSYGQDKNWTLEECVNYAWENNLTVRSSELTQLNNEIALKESRFAMLPNLGGNGNIGKSFGRSIDPSTNSFNSTDFVNGSFSLSSSVTLSSGGIIRNRIKQNELSLDASELDLQKAKNDIGVTVATNFLNVLLNQEQLKNATFQLESTKAQLDRTTKLVEAGSLPLTNQLDLESQVATNEVSVINAENALRLAVLNLKQAMQMPADEQLNVVAPEVTVESIGSVDKDPSEIYGVALGAQPEIASALLNVESSDLGVKIAKGAFYPSLSLSGRISSNFSDRAQTVVGSTDVPITPVQIGVVQGSGDPVFSSATTRTVLITEDTRFGDQIDQNLGQAISLNLNIPLFSRYSNTAGLQRAKIAKQRAEITAENTKNQLRQTIETAYNSALGAYNTYNATVKRVKALEESFRATEQRYNVGDVNFVEYQVASNNLFAAKADLIRNKYEYVFRTKILDFYLGNPITLQ